MVRPGERLVFDVGLRRLEGGRVLVGGAPFRVLRVTASAAAIIDAWGSGAVVGDSEPERRLARRLMSAAMVHPAPDPATPAELAGVSVVIPVRDRLRALERCLQAVIETMPADLPTEVVVVDDGSREADQLRSTAERRGARLLRRPVAGGPAAARNSGLGAAAYPVVAFVDSDCVPSPGWLARLLAHLADGAVGAVAPRVVGLPALAGTSDVTTGRRWGGTGGVRSRARALRQRWLGAYESLRSPLDLGADPSPVGPGRRVPYVPGAALVARRSALGSGFDESMAVGEDVDLVWRMVEAGWQVRYEPTATVAHEHRLRVGPWLARRHEYGRSAAPLARRHPGSVWALSMSPWTLAAWALVLDGHPFVAAGSVALSAGMLARQLAPLVRAPVALAGELVVKGALGAGPALASSVRRAWWPAAVALGAAAPRRAALLLGGALAPLVGEWRRSDGSCPLAPFLIARTLDDLAYSSGVWRSCLQERLTEPLRPDVGWRLSIEAPAERAAT